MSHPVTGASPQPVATAMAAPAPSNAAKTMPTASNIGPAVKLTLSNVKQNDAAKGDPDGDGH